MSESAPSHPYYPRNLQLMTYNANELGAVAILSIFFLILVALTIPLAYICLKGYNGSYPRKIVIYWLLVSGCIHTILEGHFAVFHKDIAGRMDFLSQICK